MTCQTLRSTCQTPTFVRRVPAKRWRLAGTSERLSGDFRESARAPPAWFENECRTHVLIRQTSNRMFSATKKEKVHEQ